MRHKCKRILLMGLCTVLLLNTTPIYATENTKEKTQIYIQDNDNSSNFEEEKTIEEKQSGIYTEDIGNETKLQSSKEQEVDQIRLLDQITIQKGKNQTEFQVKIGRIQLQDENTKIQVAVWSEENGQDDLQWYSGVKNQDETWSVDVSCTNHKDTLGTYVIHVYAEDGKNEKTFIGGAKTSVEILFENALAKARVNEAQTGAEISVKQSRVTNGTMQVAVWSEENGQDDLKWYTLRCEGDEWKTSIDISNHKWGTGNYFAHTYYSYARKSYFVTGTKFYIEKLGGAEVSVTSCDIQKGEMNIQVTGIKNSAFVERIRCAVWSEVNGQDDLQWYPMEKTRSNWKLHVPFEKHHFDLGKYFIHVYAKDYRGMENCIGTLTHNLELKTDITVNVNQKQTEAKINIDPQQLIPQMKDIRLAVWSEENGQDDLKWYEIGDKKTAIIKIKNHKYSTGEYVVHMYASTGNNIPFFCGGQRFVIKKNDCDEIVLMPSEINGNKFTLLAKNVHSPVDVKNVKFAVWSESNGQDDLFFYNGKQNGSNWEVELDTFNHNYESGKYFIHVYAYDSRGCNDFIGGLKTELQLKKAESSIQVVNNRNHNSFEIEFAHDQIGKDTEEIEIAVWSKKKGQDDLRWYIAEKVMNGKWKVLVSVADHKNDSGIYFIHVYGKKTDGSKYCLKTGQESILLRWNPNVKQQVIPVKGLHKDHSFLYISDTHIISLDGTEETEVKKLGESRIGYFTNYMGMTSEEQFPYWVAYANENSVEAVLMAGDIVDYPSSANVNFLKESLSKLQRPYLYAFGNHDWQYPWGGSQEYRAMFDEITKGSSAASYMELEDLIILSVDDSSYKILPEALPIVDEALAIGKPVVIMMHVPLQTDSLLLTSLSMWGKAEMIGPDGYQPDEVTQCFLDKILAKDSPVQIILAGHVHTEDVSKINDKITQYVSNIAAGGNGAIIKLTK